MTQLLRDLGATVSSLGSDWTKYSVVGSFILYVFGYLAVRFHLTAIGIGTDLSVLDERYLFAGARFLVYLVATVPSVLLLLLLPAIIVWSLSRLRPGAAAAVRLLPERRPALIAWGAVFIAVVTIQFVMRQAFLLGNLLLSPALPLEPTWLVGLLFTEPWLPLYFGALVLMCAVSVGALLWLRDARPVGFIGGSRALLAFLAAVQILLLPINYGILIMDKVLPRVAAVADEPIAAGDAAWLVWEGKEGVTFLVRRADRSRALVTVPRDSIKRTEIVGFDPIIPTLFRRD